MRARSGRQRNIETQKNEFTGVALNFLLFLNLIEMEEAQVLLKKVGEHYEGTRKSRRMDRARLRHRGPIERSEHSSKNLWQ